MADKIALLGFGVVGQGYYEIAQNAGKGLLPDTIVVKDPLKKRDSQLPFYYDPSVILDSFPDILLELISDPKEAYVYVTTALRNGKTVISANKKMLANHLPELIALQQKHGGNLLYEASAAAGIPIITTLETHFEGDSITALEGILNGSSNYILTRIFEDNLSFQDALTLAQEKGFAEADPSLDINGSDVASKLSILSLHAFGTYIHESEIPTLGIQHLTEDVIALAKSLGLKIKLIAKAKYSEEGLKVCILPTFIDSKDAFFQIENEYNAVKVHSLHLSEQFFKGKGAGSLPTGAAVYGDLNKAMNGFSYSYSKTRNNSIQAQKPVDHKTEVLISSVNPEQIKLLIQYQTEMFEIDGKYHAIGQMDLGRLTEQQLDPEVSIVAINETNDKHAIMSGLKATTKTEVNPA